MTLNPHAAEFYPSPSSSPPESGSFMQQIAALDSLSLEDFYEVWGRPVSVCLFGTCLPH